MINYKKQMTEFSYILCGGTPCPLSWREPRWGHWWGNISCFMDVRQIQLNRWSDRPMAHLAMKLDQNENGE